MKKKMIVFALAFCLVLSNGMLVFAAENDDISSSESNTGANEQILMMTEGEGEETGSFTTEAGIAAYEAYTTYEEAVAEKSLEKMQTAKSLLESATDTLDQGGDEAFFEDVEMLFTLLPIGEGDDDAFNAVTEFYYMLGYKVDDFLMLAEAYEAYLEEPSAENCEAFFAATNELVTKRAELDETLFTPFYGKSLEDVMEEASEILNEFYDSEYTNAKKVANAYNGLKNTFLYGGDGVIQQAVEKFPETLELLKAMTDEELEELAGYLGVASGKEAYEMVCVRWESVQAFMEFPALYAAYKESGSAEDAENLIACYERIGEDFTKELLLDKYEDLESVMAAAGEDVKLAEESETEESKPVQSTEECESAPETGDENTLFLFAALFAVAAAALAAVRKSRA